MTNNVVAPARGTTLATDEIAGVHYPIDKIAFGIEDAVTLVSATDPLPVGDAAVLAKLTSILAKLITSPATEATLASCLAHLQTIASEDAGLATAAAQATAQTALSAIVSALAGTLTVDASGHVQPVSATALPLPAGAATQTTLAAALTALQGTLAVSAASLPLPAGAATQTTLAAILAALGATVTVDGSGHTQPISAASLPLPTGAATQTTLAALLSAVQGTLTTAPAASQDPIFDHANGTKTSVTASATIITPPTGCSFLRISTDVDIYVNTAGGTAVDDGTAIRIVANAPEVIPVTAATAVKALSSSGTAVVRCTPLKVR